MLLIYDDIFGYDSDHFYDGDIIFNPVIIMWEKRDG